MLSFLLVTVPIFGAAALANPAVFGRAVCNKDNCFNVMTNTLSVATPFCSTWLQSTSTVYVTPVATVSGTVTISPSVVSYPTIPGQVVPTHIASQCQLATPTVSSAPVPLTARYSTACNCLPTPVVPATVTTTLVAPATTTTASVAAPAPTPVGNPFEIQVSGTGTLYDGYDLTYNGCPTGYSGQPFVYVSGGTDTFVFGSDGFLHSANCFNVIAGVFSGNEPAVLFFVDPTNSGTTGFVPSPCSNVDGHLSCSGANGESVFYFPNESFGVLSELYFGDANYGTAITVAIV